MKATPLEMSLLFDFYGETLTEKQRELFDLYYNEDLSLSEIAEHAGITRQGVRDSIKRAEHALGEMESKLGLVARYGDTERCAGELREEVSRLRALNIDTLHSPEAEAIADRMEDGMSEEEAVAAMGTPGEVAEATLDDLPAVPRAIAKTRRRSTALLWVLTIVGSPVWVPLLLAFAAVAVTVYVCIWVLALCVWVIAATLGAVGAASLALVAAGVAVGHVPYVIVMLGCGLAFIGVALLVGAGAWEASKRIARLSALWAGKAASPFWKGKGEKGGAAAHLAA